ncbi:MAG: GMP synthase (glutamine-hydrolyzing), partial [Bacteroidales bacterium]|nr:GMP synthase (glutamine-hydrolyzing) [Bacteroidales bacterium]
MQTIIILDHGSQYTQLIARKVRELNVYCEIHPFNKVPKFGSEVAGVILSGSPCSVRDEDAPKPDLWFKGKMPVLGVCYGAQYMVNAFGGNVVASKIREYG